MGHSSICPARRITFNSWNTIMGRMTHLLICAFLFVFVSTLHGSPLNNRKGFIRPEGFMNQETTTTAATTTLKNSTTPEPTTTINPIVAYCTGACITGSAGPECHCPGHPVGWKSPVILMFWYWVCLWSIEDSKCGAILPWFSRLKWEYPINFS